MKTFKQYIDESRVSDLHILAKQGLSVEKVNAILQISELLNIDWRKVKDIVNEDVSKDYSSKTYPSSYKKNKQLLALIDKYDDPFKFVLAVISAMSAGKLKLRRIGVANTREIVALWNDIKNKKISPALVEYIVSLSTEELLDEGVIDNIKRLFKKREKIDISGWKSKVHKGKHPDVPDIGEKGSILFAIDPKTGKPVHVASGNLDDKNIRKFVSMYGLKKPT